MKCKTLICPERKRRIPEQFSWIDHRFIRDGYLQQSSRDALALYLFLVTVGNVEGISYYGDQTIGKLLNCDLKALSESRRELITLGLIAYEKPFYQVLSLNHVSDKTARCVLKKALSLKAGLHNTKQPPSKKISPLKTSAKCDRLHKTSSIESILDEIGGH